MNCSRQRLLEAEEDEILLYDNDAKGLEGTNILASNSFRHKIHQDGENSP